MTRLNTILLTATAKKRGTKANTTLNQTKRLPRRVVDEGVLDEIEDDEVEMDVYDGDIA